MDLSAGQLTFTDKKWNGHARIRHKELILLNHLKKKTVLTDIKITTKDETNILFQEKKIKKKQQSYLQKSVITV